jgi:hypothetical protein
VIGYALRTKTLTAQSRPQHRRSKGDAGLEALGTAHCHESEESQRIEFGGW